MESFRPLLVRYGLTEQQWRIIRALHEYGPLEPRLLCDLCTISSPSLAGVLARMEASDLVCKERFATDQRRVLVSLSGTSVELIALVSRDLEKRYRQIEEVVGSETLARLYGAVGELLAGLEEGGAPASVGNELHPEGLGR